MASFNVQPSLSSERLSLTPLHKTHREGLYQAASDPKIWEQHPASTRYRREVFDGYFDFLLAAGGTVVATTIEDQQIIGCSRFYPVPDQPGEYGIGFTFLKRSHWGGDWNREMKSLMVRHVLNHRDRVWFHIAPDNKRSQIATTRLGAQFEYDAMLDLSGGETMTKCYSMTETDWLNSATPQSRGQNTAGQF